MSNEDKISKQGKTDDTIADIIAKYVHSYRLLYVKSLDQDKNQYKFLLYYKENLRSQSFTYDDDVYLRLQHGKGFHNLVYKSYVKYINPAKRISNEHNNSKHLCNNFV
jgi:hypothetical protein